MSFRILSQDCRISNESYLTGLNNNDLIVGPSGAGKTRGYVLPNILQCNENLFYAQALHGALHVARMGSLWLPVAGGFAQEV